MEVWFDELKEEVFVDLDQMFIDEFIEVTIKGNSI